MKFSEDERKSLLSNQNVLKVTDKSICFTPEFKLEALKLYKKGQSSNSIFEDYGFDPKMFKKDYFLKTLKRWSKKVIKEGKKSLSQESRGRKSTGRPKKQSLDELSMEEMKALLESQQEVIEELKKHHALARKK